MNLLLYRRKEIQYNTLTVELTVASSSSTFLRSFCSLDRLVDFFPRQNGSASEKRQMRQEIVSSQASFTFSLRVEEVALYANGVWCFSLSLSYFFSSKCICLSVTSATQHSSCKKKMVNVTDIYMYTHTLLTHRMVQKCSLLIGT